MRFWQGGDTTKIRIDYSCEKQAHQFYYLEIDPMNGKRSYAAPVQMIEYKPQESIKPFFTVRDGSEGILQAMMDSLWSMGYRPEDRGTVDSVLAAKNQHLADLKQIAFHALKMPQPAQGSILQ